MGDVWTVKVVAIAAAAVAMTVVGSAGRVSAAPRSAPPASPAFAADPRLPARVSSPPVDPAAPYTPMVRRLIDQLLPDPTPTLDQLRNAARLFEGQDTRYVGTDGIGSCHTVGAITAPTGTDPSISPLCWADAVGIDVTSGPNQRKATAPPEPLALAASFDRALNNAWGQVEGAEGRRLMATGLYGPQVDVLVHPNWQRALDTLGEDPFLTSELAVEQVDGVQGQGLMAQVKHLAGFSASNRTTLTEYQDQAFRELVLPPFEAALTRGAAASVMCAYNAVHDVSSHLPPAPPTLFTPSPYGTDTSSTWPLDEAHFSCEQPLTLNQILRHDWGSVAIVGSDYPATYSTAAAAQGLTQEFPFAMFLGAGDPAPSLAPPLIAGDVSNPSGDTCALAQQSVPCATPGAAHVGGLPGPGCPEPNGCGLVNAVHTGAFPLVVFEQMLALVLYQEERFGLLGCDQSPPAGSCTNPGGVDGDRTGAAALPAGSTAGTDSASAPIVVGTRSGDAAIVERAAEEGAVLLVNHDVLPIRPSDLGAGIAVSGAGADHLIAAPSKETASGFEDRNAISPLDALRDLSDRPDAFTFTPAGSPTGIVVPSSMLRADDATSPGLSRRTGPGSPAVDATVDFTTESASGTLPAESYSWSGTITTDAADAVIARLQVTAGTPADAIGLTIDGADVPLSPAASPYCGQYYQRLVCVPADHTVSGATEEGLANLASAELPLTAGSHRVEIRFRATADGASLRFAASRRDGDVAAAATSAAGASMAVVFVDDDGVTTAAQTDRTDPSTGLATLPDADVRLIRAVAAANPRTVVVLNTANPVVTAPWIDDPGVGAVLEMWNSGGEGGTATARLLLGLAQPGGRTPVTWPRASTDTIWGYDQPTALFPGDTAGAHPERLNGVVDPDPSHCAPDPTDPQRVCTKTVMSQGIFSGYRFHDRLGLAPRFPFGFGLTYTTITYSHPTTTWHDGHLRVGFTVENEGRRVGAAVPQVYLGPSDGPTTAQQADRALVGFDRITLEPGASRTVTIEVPDRLLQHWDEPTQAWVTLSGRRTVTIGEPDVTSKLPLTTTITVGRSGATTTAHASNRSGSQRSTDLTGAIRAGVVLALVLALLVVIRRRTRRRHPIQEDLP